MLFGDGMKCGLQQQPEVIRTPGLDKPVAPGTLPELNAGFPVHAHALHHSTLFRNYMLAGYERHTRESRVAVAVGNDIAKLDERVAVPYRLQTEPAQVLEPGLVEQVPCGIVLVAVVIDEFERARHNEPHALLYAARKMRVGHGIAVDVVQLLPGRMAWINRALPRPAPVLDVVL